MSKVINHKARCVAFAAAGVTAVGSAMGADENPIPSPTNTNQTQAAAPPATPAPPPLMAGLDKMGVAGPLRSAGINIYGYAEAGYMRDLSAPSTHDGPTFIGFNSYKNTVVLDKISLNIERTVDPTKKQFDVGFHLEGIYGTDAAFIHSDGLADTQSSRYQWDPLQAYLDVTLPGVPVRIRAGKWIELAGFEQYSANIYGAFGDPARALYSYSYQFLYAEPGTQTGVLGTYVLNPQWTFDAGATLGWNQSLRSSHDSLDFLGRVTFTPSDKTAVIFVMTEGPEYPTSVGKNLPPRDRSDFWTALDLVVTQKVTDKLSLGIGVDYVVTPRISGLAGNVKQWGGLAGYVSYALDPHLTLNSRLEWYKDAANGFSTGAPVGADYTEVTLGVAIKPFPKNDLLSHFLLRPEIRYDHSDHRVFGSGDHNQVTVCADALLTF